MIGNKSKCKYCGKTIFQSGGDSYGNIYFECTCSEYKTKDAGFSPFHYNGSEIKRQNFKAGFNKPS